MITEFVVDRVERSFDNSFSTSGASVGIAVATLPSIDEFVREEPGNGAAEAPDEFVQRTSRSPWGTYEARHEVSGAPSSHAASPPAAALEPDLLSVESHIPVVGAEAAIVNEVVEPAEAWVASAAEESAAELESVPETALGTVPAAATTQEASVTAHSEPEPAVQPAPEVWVAEERDAFDWHGVASLAVPPAEDQRAAEEWSSTEWERSGGSVRDHVAGLLAQVSRRIRSGELEVQGSKQMGTEAALVAALGALLAESKK
jgi:hypothetical protein